MTVLVIKTIQVICDMQILHIEQIKINTILCMQLTKIRESKLILLVENIHKACVHFIQPVVLHCIVQ